MKVKIDKDLVPMKAHYFLFNAGTAPVVPFMPTLARQLGFSTVIVGTMYTILPIIGMLAKPFFGFIADRYQRHRMLFLLAEILTAVAFFLIMFVPPIPTVPPTVQFHCHSGVTELRYCSQFDSCIQQGLGAHYGSDSVQCHLRCAAQPFMWEIICADWLHYNGSEPTCNGTASHFDISTMIRPSDSLMEEECLHFPIVQSQAQYEGENVTMYCPKEKQYFNATCELRCDDTYLTEQLTETPVIKNSDAFGMHQFWAFFGLLILSWIGMAVVVSIGDAICFSMLGERHHLFGNQRLCGSIGSGIFAIITGLVVDAMSGGSVNKDYTIVFWMTAIILAFDVFASTKLKHTQAHQSPNIIKDLGKMFLSLRCVIFFVWCVVIGLCTALVWNFLFLHLEELGAKSQGCDNSMKTLEGLAMGIQCFGGELPFFFLSGWILRKIGYVNAMNVVLFGFGVRFILYSVLQDPWYVLPIELLNGVTFGLFYATMASYASIVAPPGTEATMQGLVGAIFEGVGVSMGSLIGGILFDVVGGGHTFQIFGIGAFIAFVAHVCAHKCLKLCGHDTMVGARTNSNGKTTNGNKQVCNSEPTATTN